MAKYIKFVSDSELKDFLANLTKSELKKYAQSVFNVANKRISRMEGQTGIISPALTALNKRRNGNTHFSSAGKDLTALEQEITEAMAFTNLSTSTLGGARAFTSKLRDVMGDKVDDKEYISHIFDTMHAVSERIPQLAKNMIGTDTILNEIVEEQENGDINVLDDASREDNISSALDAVVDEFNKMQDSWGDSGSLW